ncbi:CMP-sialic acid transporter 5-like [Phragmites australis]|uniref:CMP-sialic acid transporter 5-like n=1 Tax=Phragmites australis TaxID=29695 RepID=UPI002D79C783|nr:CMP-sialic acid transporter 5-like [Phragmites australis]
MSTYEAQCCSGDEHSKDKWFANYIGENTGTDTILKKYSSTVATIFTGLASAAFLGHKLTINFLLGISVVFISMHQFFSPVAKVKDDKPTELLESEDTQKHRSSESSFVNMTAGATDDASHRIGTDERQPLLPT